MPTDSKLGVSTQPLIIKNETVVINDECGIDNVFDYVDRTPFGRNRATSTPGRTFYVSALIKFKNN